MGADMRIRALAVLLPALCAPGVSQAQLRVLDRLDEREDVGWRSRANQQRVGNLLAGGVVGLALLEGTETRLGRTAWQAADAALLSAATTEAIKRVTGRPRPIQDPSPTVWFTGPHNRSFPSGESAMAAAFTTPFILAYHQEHPAVWALAGVPLYVAKSRMASQAHWLSDVTVGLAIGTAYGWYATQRETPLVLSASGQTVFIGLRYRF